MFKSDFIRNFIVRFSSKFGDTTQQFYLFEFIWIIFFIQSHGLIRFLFYQQNQTNSTRNI